MKRRIQFTVNTILLFSVMLQQQTYSAESETITESQEQTQEPTLTQQEETENESEFIIIEEEDEAAAGDENFIPSVQISEDLPVAFPIDI